MLPRLGAGAMFRMSVFAAGLLAAGMPAAASAANIAPPTQASAAMKAVAFAPMPKPAYIEVKLRDDAPENVELAWAMHEALQARGLLAKNGPTLRLTLEAESAAMIGDVPASRSPAKDRSKELRQADRAKLMGVLRATLVEVASSKRLWEAEIVYETIWGDVVGGAAKLVPTLADSLGQSVDRSAFTLR
jgi:hypothetical protein